MAKTKKPTGLSITRDGDRYIFKWKIADDNYGAGQDLQYRTKGKTKHRKWNDVSIGSAATSKSVTIPKASFVPTGPDYLTEIEFRVRGKRNSYEKGNKTVTPEMSEWTNKTLTISRPAKPVITKTRGEQTNVCSFSWSGDDPSDGGKILTNVIWETRLVKNSNETDGSKISWKSGKLGWDTGVGSATGTKTITEDSALIAGESYTRWFRARSRGPAGVTDDGSDWVYSKHVYATPFRAAIVEAKATKKSGSYLVEVTWTAQRNAAHPIDETIVQYTKAVPEADMECPSGATWSNAGSSKDTKGKDKAVFNVDGLLEPDQSLYVRVNNYYDGRESLGEAFLVRSGYLADPTDLSVVISGRSATVNATNNSNACVYSGTEEGVIKNFLTISFKGKNLYKTPLVLGVIPKGTGSATITLPDLSGEDSYKIIVQAVAGTYKAESASDGTTRYTVNETLTSQIKLSYGGDLPLAPTGIAAEQKDGSTVRLSWNWNWANADSVELSWADHEDAWESTESPESFTINGEVRAWNIAGLESGWKWYFRTRFIRTTEAGEEYGPYSDTVVIDMSLPPAKPTLALSASAIPEDGTVTASWGYTSSDGTEQSYAEVRVAEINGDVYEPTTLAAHTDAGRSVTVYAEQLNWTPGNVYLLMVRVKASSGSFSEWSDPEAVAVLDQLESSVSSASLRDIQITDDVGVIRTVKSLTDMPFVITASGAGAGGTTKIWIERAESYFMDRPDEDPFNGYEGEAVFRTSMPGEGQMTITREDMAGALDDGAKYTLVAMAIDGYGRSAEARIDFEVHWSHQALIPDAAVTIDPDTLVAVITPEAPTGTLEGDTCDIYRLSADKPVLVYPGAEFGTGYVDPYPAIGEMGGHRIVFRTSNGDYITQDNKTAWKDIGAEEGDILSIEDTVIDFGRDRVRLPYDLKLRSSWGKEFTEKKYLGGSIQGDWGAAVSRKSSVDTVVAVLKDPETIRMMRRLAEHTGICHVRTNDGSSYAADIQVTESSGSDTGGKLASFSLSITRVSPQGYDGTTLEAWEGENGLE